MSYDHSAIAADDDDGVLSIFRPSCRTYQPLWRSLTVHQYGMPVTSTCPSVSCCWC